MLQSSLFAYGISRLLSCMSFQQLVTESLLHVDMNSSDLTLHSSHLFITTHLQIFRSFSVLQLEPTLAVRRRLSDFS